MRLARDAGLEVRGAEQATRRELCEALEKFLPQGEAAATQALARAAPARRKGKLVVAVAMPGVKVAARATVPARTR